MTSARQDRRGWWQKLRAGRGGGSSGLFGLVIGLLVGVMVSALVFPKDVDVTVEGGGSVAAGERSGASAGVGAGSTPAFEVDGEPTAGAGDAGVPGSQAAPSGGGGGGTAATAGSPSGGGGGTGAPVAAPGQVVKLRIGVGVLDLGVIRNLGPAFDNGDGVAHMRAWLDGVRRDGLVPVNGYDLEFVYRKYDVLQAESQRAACRGFVQDDKVLAVLAGSNFQLGAECVAREFKTPLLTSDGVRAAAYERSPFLFTFMLSQDRLVRNWAHWAHGRGELRGKKIGIFYANNPDTEELALRVLKGELSRLGYEVTAEAPGNVTPAGGPEDAVAAQRFQAAGVDVVFVMSSPTAFAQRAEQQRYRPRYLATDLWSGTTNTSTSNVPPAQFDRALAMTGVRYGEWRAGFPDPERAAKCAEYYASASGRRRVNGNEREAEWIGMNKLCDGGWALLDALGTAPAGGLDKAALARALESVRGATLGIHDDAVFEPGRHDGTRRQRTLQWHADCKCWKAQGRFELLFVP